MNAHEHLTDVYLQVKEFYERWMAAIRYWPIRDQTRAQFARQLQAVFERASKAYTSSARQVTDEIDKTEQPVAPAITTDAPPEPTIRFPKRTLNRTSDKKAIVQS